MSYPFLHESELNAARAEHAAGDIEGSEGRAYQRHVNELLESDPEYRAWADVKFRQRHGRERPRQEPEAEL